MQFVRNGSKVQVLSGFYHGQYAIVLNNIDLYNVLIQVEGILPDRSCLNTLTISSHQLRNI